MIRLFLILLVLLPLMGYSSFPFQSSSGAYRISGRSDNKNGVAILKNGAKKDTVRFTDGVFYFKGNTERPSLALIEIQHSNDIPMDIILEPGEITVHVKNGSYIVGGTANNSSYQRIRNQLAQYRSSLKSLQTSYYEAVGTGKSRLALLIDSVHKQRIAATGKLIRGNHNYAGLVILQSIYRKEKPSDLSYFLEVFKSFNGDPVYQQIMTYYQGMVKVETGFPVPAFTLPGQDGNPVSLDAFKGKYVLIDFWYHNCVFCRKLAPALKHIYADLKPEGFEIISISIDPLTMKKEWLDAIVEDGNTWTQLWDHERTLPEKYNVHSYPHLFLLDKEGRLLEQIIGYYEEKELRQILNKYILKNYE